jgi:ATP synthase protein I
MSENQGGDGESFEARLRAARLRQGMDAQPAPTGGGGVSAMGIGLRAGVELVSALAVAVAIGWGLDRWLHTLPLFLIIFVLLGGAAGVVNVWRLVGPAPPG